MWGVLFLEPLKLKPETVANEGMNQGEDTARGHESG